LKAETEMKTIWLAGLMAIGAGAQAETVEPFVTVYISADAAVPTFALVNAQMIAGRVFADIGVPIRWREGRPRGKSRGATGTLAVRVAAHVPLRFRPGALAVAKDDARLCGDGSRQVDLYPGTCSDDPTLCRRGAAELKVGSSDGIVLCLAAGVWKDSTAT
jgi:hypothetical protein